MKKSCSSMEISFRSMGIPIERTDIFTERTEIDKCINLISIIT